MARIAVVLVVVICAPLMALQPDSRFEVASIKVSKSGLPGNIWGGGPGRFVVDGITAANLIRNALDGILTRRA